MYEKIRLVAARIRELNRTEPPSLLESRLPVILSLSPWRKRVGSMGKEGEEKKIGWKRRGRNVDGERLATLGRECTHISHNFPRKFPPLRAGIVQLKFIFEHPGSGFHICVRNSFRFCCLSLSFTSLVPLALFLFRSCPPFLLSPTSSAAT